MEPVRRIVAQAMPLNRADVDTDQIIPAKYLKLVERTGFGRFLFDTWRKDESFVLNDPRYKEAQVLIGGPNFGCGSSVNMRPGLGLRPGDHCTAMTSSATTAPDFIAMALRRDGVDHMQRAEEPESRSP
jgi:hypothetical protein